MPVDLHVTESGTGQPLVLLHAFPLDASIWAGVARVLAPAYRLVAPDLRGFGRSPLGADEPSIEAMADDVVGVLDRLDLDDFVLVGLSMGGYVTMALLRRHAHRVRAVVLADTKASVDSDAARADRLRIADVVATERGPRILHHHVVPTLLGPHTRASAPAIVEQVRALVSASRPDGVAWAQRAMAARTESFDMLAGLDLPVLVVRGEEDELSKRSDADAILEVVRHGRLVEIPQAGHLSALEAPAEFAAAVESVASPAR